jgi:hypothetical protein
MSKPIFLKDADVTFTFGGAPGTDATVQCQVHALAVTPEVPDLERYVTLCGSGSYSAQGKPTWTLEATIAQGWGAEDLARLLWDHQGEEVGVYAQIHGEGVAASATTPGVTCTVIAQPGPYGGEAETWLEQELALPLVADPVLVETPPVVE